MNLLASLYTPQFFQEEVSHRQLLWPRNDIKGLKNFAQVTPELYRGAQPTAEGFRQLKRRGIRTVVNLRSYHSDLRKLRGLGLQHARIHCKAWRPLEENVAAFFKLIRDPENHPIFVHCQHGADRTGMMIAIFRMFEQGWDPREAVREIHHFKFHPIFRRIVPFLMSFDAERLERKLLAPDSPDVCMIE